MAVLLKGTAASSIRCSVKFWVLHYYIWNHILKQFCFKSLLIPLAIPSNQSVRYSQNNCFLLLKTDLHVQDHMLESLTLLQCCQFKLSLCRFSLWQEIAYCIRRQYPRRSDCLFMFIYLYSFLSPFNVKSAHYLSIWWGELSHRTQL